MAMSDTMWPLAPAGGQPGEFGGVREQTFEDADAQLELSGGVGVATLPDGAPVVPPPAHLPGNRPLVTPQTQYAAVQVPPAQVPAAMATSANSLGKQNRLLAASTMSTNNTGTARLHKIASGHPQSGRLAATTPGVARQAAPNMVRDHGRGSRPQSPPASSPKSEMISRTRNVRPARGATQNVSHNSPQAAPSLRRPGSGFTQVGYPRGPRSNVGIEDLKGKLEQVKRETREMRAAENQVKWGMKREVDRLRKMEEKEDNRDLTESRQQFKRDMQDLAKSSKKAAKENQILESREYQEFKRQAKQCTKEDEQQANMTLYHETKDASEWVTKLKRVLPPERRRLIVEEHLDQHKLLAEYQLEEQHQGKIEECEAALAREKTEMDHAMSQAMRERDMALQSLEYLRAQQRSAVPQNRHIHTRPLTPY